VKWNVVCRPKSSGGLGVKDIRVVNISLLSKWRWRLLTNDGSMWKEVIKGKYGDALIGRVDLGEASKPWFASTWWKDICSIGTNIDFNWFSQAVVKKVGNGEETSFWRDIWIGNTSLQEKFPRLFSISSQKDETVARLQNRVTGSARWDFVWRRRLLQWETNLLDELYAVINAVILTDVDDG
jgi:hypothetical protein